MGNVLRRETGFELDKEIDAADVPEQIIERISNMKKSARENVKISDEDNLNDLELNDNNQDLFNGENNAYNNHNGDVINNNFEDSNNDEEERLRQLREEERRKKLEEERKKKKKKKNVLKDN